MNYFPAASGTLIATQDAEADHGVSYIPVVGWVHVQGNLCFPLTPMPFNGMTHGNAIVNPDGFTVDPTHGVVFANVDEWLSFILTAKRKAEPRKPAEELPPAEAIKEQAKTARAAAPTGGPIVFGAKAYETQSFWSMPSQDAVFILPGGVNYPKDPRVVKVKRDEMMSLKRAGAVVIDPFGEVQEDQSEEQDEEEDLDDLV